MNRIASAFPAAGDAAAWIALGLISAMAAWLLRDGLRLVAHLRAADSLIAAGMPERDALRAAGCLFWQLPWYQRLFRRYPELQG
ncbi:hypothetical protein [Pseudoduganella umbonata]|uniref:Uncharacterized protein n=1 Tax=Pseudoduganella umbonata TaxID=864828 RepID=A0A4P8HLM2_9BURK|nr:hypothetical protein [Pseudoduganella umbonata]MBB3225177.1 hypothetical protein [Pseudoduganella umbonata]QCP09294.1 hypothetical protein FCL38_01735 [Pseudoduganella umbonata]